jgi:hypothetical protein
VAQGDQVKQLSVIIAGDASKGIAALREFEQQAKQAETSTTTASKKIEQDIVGIDKAAEQASSGGGLFGKLMGGMENIGRGTGLDSLTNLFGGTGGALGQNITKELGGAEAALKGVSTAALAAGAVVAVAGAAAIKFGADSVTSFTSGADAVRRFSQVTGTSAESASQFVNLAGLMGVSTERCRRRWAASAAISTSTRRSLRTSASRSSRIPRGTCIWAPRSSR